MDYTVFRWRKKMGRGWFEALVTPPDRILLDMEYMHLEDKYGQKAASPGGK